MVVSLKPERLRRYKDVAKLLIKYGRSDLLSPAGLENSVLPEEIAAETGRVEIAEDLLERRDAVARVHAMAVGLLGPRRLGGVVVHMEHVDRGPAEELEAGEVAAALEDVIDIR